jgi:hypothetical protein
MTRKDGSQYPNPAAGNPGLSAGDVRTLNSIYAKPTKIAIFNPDSAKWTIDQNGDGAWSRATDPTIQFGSPGDRPVVGDWNGDGKAKMGIFNPQSSTWCLDYNGNRRWDDVGGGDKKFVFANVFAWGSNVPVAGDWTGDGTSKVGTYDPQHGVWLLDMNGDGQYQDGIDLFATFGNPGDIPVTGDWDGTGKTSIGIYNPSTGMWWLDTNHNFSWDGGDAAPFQFFFFDLPAVGDWDGTGFSKAAVYNQATQRWSLDLHDTHDAVSAPSIPYGGPSDIPVPGAW